MPLNNNGIGVQMFVRVVSAPLSVPRRGAAPTGCGAGEGQAPWEQRLSKAVMGAVLTEDSATTRYQYHVNPISMVLSTPRSGAAPTGGTAPGVPRGMDAKKLRGAEASRSQDCCS